MRLDKIGPAKGSRRSAHRVGRGNGSGSGNYSGRGMKGQKSRSGGGVSPWFEGGQLPLVKRLPRRRGFTNIFRRAYIGVNIERLKNFPEGSEITPEKLVESGIIKNTKTPVKILGKGELDRPFTVMAHRFSASARDKIEKAGGQTRGTTS